MKKTLRILMIAVFSIFWVTGAAWAISFNFANVDNAKITFVGFGDTFTFDNSTVSPNLGYDIQITGVVGGGGSAVSLLGNIGGTFTIGAITTVAPGYQTAPVSSSLGILSIYDGTPNLFSANLQWVSIYTIGLTGGINSGGTINLTNISYGGSNADLLTFKNQGAGSGISTTTFQFSSPMSLTMLTTDGQTNSTSYSGSMTPVAEPTTLLLLGIGLVGLAGATRRMIKK